MEGNRVEDGEKGKTMEKKMVKDGLNRGRVLMTKRQDP